MTARRSIAAALILLLTAARALAQEATEEEKKPIEPGPWSFGATVGVSLSQSSYTTNWAGGDKSAFSWAARGDMTAERQFTKTFNLANGLQLAYGQTGKQVEDPNNPSKNKWDAPDKTTDLILFESTGRWTLDSYVDPYVAFRLDSQFADQSTPVGTIYFNPVLLKETAGIAKAFQKTKEEELIARFGFGFRQSLGQSFTDSTGENKTSQVSNDGGFEFQTDATQLWLEKRLQYKTKFLVYWPVYFAQESDLEAFDAEAQVAQPGREAVSDFWRDPDVNWQNTFTSKVTKWLSVDLYLQFVYNKYDESSLTDPEQPLPVRIASVDKGVRKAGQFKETLAIGLTYTLF